jgi:hypothetical protein
MTDRNYELGPEETKSSPTNSKKGRIRKALEILYNRRYILMQWLLICFCLSLTFVTLSFFTKHSEGFWHYIWRVLAGISEVGMCFFAIPCIACDLYEIAKFLVRAMKETKDMLSELKSIKQDSDKS